MTLTTRGNLLAAACLLSATIFISSAPRAAEQPHSFDENYFCLHVHNDKFADSFNAVPFAVFRTWDSSIGWPSIQPEKDKWNWTLLDEAVSLARKNNAKIIMTLGMTPPWAAKNPDAPSPYGSCCSSSPPRDLRDWENFITALAERNEKLYSGTIRYWEVWNEPDNAAPGYAFYSGTPEELAAMAASARPILKKFSPDNLILSPGITQMGALWLERFLNAGGLAAVDVTTAHFYWDWHTPYFADFDTAMQMITSAISRAGASEKPFWITETGFNTGHYKTVPQRRMALAETLILPAMHGARVSCSYSMNSTIFTGLYDTKNGALTDSGRSYILLRRWLLGATAVSTETRKPKLRIINLEKHGATARLIWRYTDGQGAFDPAGAEVYTLDGGGEPEPESGTITIGNSPVLIAQKGFRDW